MAEKNPDDYMSDLSKLAADINKWTKSISADLTAAHYGEAITDAYLASIPPTAMQNMLKVAESAVNTFATSVAVKEASAIAKTMRATIPTALDAIAVRDIMKTANVQIDRQYQSLGMAVRPLMQFNWKQLVGTATTISESVSSTAWRAEIPSLSAPVIDQFMRDYDATANEPNELAPDPTAFDSGVDPGFRTLSRRVLRDCGPVGEDVHDGHEEAEDVYAGVSA